MHPVGTRAKAFERSLLRDAQRLAHLLPGSAIGITGDKDLLTSKPIRGVREGKSRCRDPEMARHDRFVAARCSDKRRDGRVERLRYFPTWFT